MSVYKDEKTGKWYALTWYHDWKGEGRQKCKRGFETKKDALEWERTFLQQNATDMDMTFSAFCELYERDRRPRLKESTWQTKANIIQGKIENRHRGRHVFRVQMEGAGYGQSHFCRHLRCFHAERERILDMHDFCPEKGLSDRRCDRPGKMIVFADS